MQGAEGHDKFIADFLRKTVALGKFQMMGVAGLLAADQAGLSGDSSQVSLVPKTPLSTQLQARLVDPWAGRDLG